MTRSASTPVDLSEVEGKPGVTIDDFFKAAPPVETAGQVWRLDQGRLVATPVQLGISDGDRTQILSGDVHPGEALITGVALPNVQAPGSPFGRGPFGFPGRGGFRGGRFGR